MCEHALHPDVCGSGSRREHTMQTKHFDTKRMVLLAMLSGILLLMSFTPLGYLNIGPLAVSLNMIPVAIGAVALGPTGGAFLGAVFGITSCLQCVGIGGTSAMGVALFEINPILTLVQRFFPRLAAGYLSGIACRWICKCNRSVAYFLTGLLAALLNTILFMSTLVLLFSSTPYLQNQMGGQSVIAFMFTFVGVNAVVELLAATAVVGAVCKALEKTKLIGGC